MAQVGIRLNLMTVSSECMVNEATNFIKRLSAVPRPPNEGMSEAEIQQQQREVQQREQELQENLSRLRRKKKREEEKDDSEHRASRIEDEDADEQTPYSKRGEEGETQETPKESPFMNKIKNAVHKVDERLDEFGEEIENAAERAYTRSKEGTAKFLKDTKDDFDKAMKNTHRARTRKAAAPLVSPAARERSAAFAIRDYERRHTLTPAANSGFSLSDNNPSQNPYIGFSDMTGFGELSRDAFSLDTSQFGFSLIGDSEKFGGAMYQDEKPFGGFNVKQERGFNVSYSGEFGAFRHSRNESFSFLPKPPKQQPKRKNNKVRKSSRDWDISRLIF